MADIELFVERLASMQVHNLKVWVDAAREEIIAKQQTKLNYARLTEEEKHRLVKISNKSTLL